MSRSSKNESFEALRDALIVRKKVTGVLRVLALQSQKRLENLEENLAKATTFDDEILKAKEAIREERFNFWLVKEECRTVAAKGAELTGSLRSANTIWPTYMAEFTERRVFMDRALAACNVLQDELQYIAEAVYADKNKFTALVLEIEALFKKIKSVRQADNRFLKDIKDVNQKV
ncbi:MAG: hypothetical protein IJP91_00700 [Synergistaceae bacterium]|nr:hypothetical protein [Synergistaceae bacterium]